MSIFSPLRVLMFFMNIYVFLLTIIPFLLPIPAVLIDAKVGEDVIKQELAKKADVLALGAYTKKSDSDALVSNAMGEHAKQVEVCINGLYCNVFECNFLRCIISFRAIRSSFLNHECGNAFSTPTSQLTSTFNPMLCASMVNMRVSCTGTCLEPLVHILQIFLLNTILDNPMKSGESGGEHNGDTGGFGYDQKMRLLALESYRSEPCPIYSYLLSMVSGTFFDCAYLLPSSSASLGEPLANDA